MVWELKKKLFAAKRKRARRKGLIEKENHVENEIVTIRKTLVNMCKYPKGKQYSTIPLRVENKPSRASKQARKKITRYVRDYSTMAVVALVTITMSSSSLSTTTTTKQPFSTNMMQLNHGNKLYRFIVSLNV